MSIKLGLRWFYRTDELHDMPEDLFILIQTYLPDYDTSRLGALMVPDKDLLVLL